MRAIRRSSQLYVALSGEADTPCCDRCGKVSRTVWGEVIESDATRAVYFVRWSLGNVLESGASIDLVIGTWGGGGAADRCLIQLQHFIGDDGAQVMVVDAVLTETMTALAARALRRADVIGHPLADDVFAIYDAIMCDDARLSELTIDAADH